MLRIRIPKYEGFNEQTQEFVDIPECVLQLEHSLVSISKWESIHEKPFFDSQKTNEELLDYIKCMTLTQNVSDEVYKYLQPDQLNEIVKYMQSKMTATTFNDLNKSKSKKEIFTSELIYYYMIGYQIPFECQKWHINRLMTLIRVCSEKNNPKKMSKSEIMSRNKALNAARKAKLHTAG